MIPRPHRRGLPLGVALFLLAAPARAEQFFAVLPLDVTNTDGKISKAGEAALEATLRDTATDALTGLGWAIIDAEAMSKTHVDKGPDPTQCSDASCHLALARAVKADKFLSGAVQFVEGEYTASMQLVDVGSGRVLATLDMEADTVKALRLAFRSKATGFFRRGGLFSTESPPAATDELAPSPVPSVPVLSAPPTPAATASTASPPSTEAARSVRPAPAVAAVLADRHVVTSDTVYDTRTHLTWQRDLSPEPRSWENARDFCSGLNIGGYTDWRLPGTADLLSIVNASTPPDPNAFTYWDAQVWSATPTGTAGFSYVVSFDHADRTAMESKFAVRCVRAATH